MFNCEDGLVYFPALRLLSYIPQYLVRINLIGWYNMGKIFWRNASVWKISTRKAMFQRSPTLWLKILLSINLICLQSIYTVIGEIYIFYKANDSSLFYICILISLNELGLKMYTVRQLRNLENVNYHKMSNGEVQSDIWPFDLVWPLKWSLT